MSGVKRQGSWQEDIARNFSRLFLRGRSQEKEKSGADGGGCSSDTKTKDVSAAVREIREEGLSPELVLNLSQMFQGSEKGSILAAAEGSTSEKPPYQPAPSQPSGWPVPAPPLDAFFRKLGSLFQSPAKADVRELPGANPKQPKLQSWQDKDVVVEDTDLPEMTWAAGGRQEPHDPTAQPLGEGGAHHLLQESQETTAEEVEEGEGGTGRALEKERQCTELQEEQHLVPDEVAGEIDPTACSITIKRDLPLKEVGDDRHRLALVSPPIVTYGTYRGPRKIEKMKRRCQEQTGSSVPEGEEDQGSNGGLTDPSSQAEKMADLVFGSLTAARFPHTQEANAWGSGCDTNPYAGVPATCSNLLLMLPGASSTQSALCQEKKREELTGPLSGIGSAVMPISSAGKDSSEMWVCSSNADNEEKRGLEKKVTQLTADVANRDTKAESEQKEALSLPQCLLGSLWTADDAGNVLNDLAGEGGGTLMKVSDECLQNVGLEVAFQLESKLLVSNILKNALAALEKIETIEYENRALSTTSGAYSPNFPAELEQSTESCFQKDINFLEQDCDGSSTQSSGYQSVVGLDTDIRNHYGLNVDLWFPVGFSDHGEREQIPAESQKLTVFKISSPLVSGNGQHEEEMHLQSSHDVKSAKLTGHEEKTDQDETKGYVQNNTSDFYSDSLYEKQCIDTNNDDITKVNNVPENLKYVSGEINEDRAQVDLVSEGTDFTGTLSTECGEGPISEVLSSGKDSTESSRQLHSLSACTRDNALLTLDVAHVEKVETNTENSKSCNRVESDSLVSVKLVGNKLSTIMFHSEAEASDIVQSDRPLKQELNKAVEMPNLFTKSSQTPEASTGASKESLNSQLLSIVDGLDVVTRSEKCGVCTPEKLYETLGTGDQSFIPAEGHLVVVDEDEHAAENNTPQQTSLGQTDHLDEKAGRQDLENPKCLLLVLAPGTNNENGQQKSVLKTSDCGLLTEHWQNLEMPRQCAGGSIQDNVNNWTSRFSTQNWKMLPEVLPGATRSELSSHHLHRFHNMDMREGDRGFNIINEEEEADAVFINDTSVTLSPASRRGKVYPFSLSPIYEEESAREEAGGAEKQEQLLAEPDLQSAEQQSSSILSLLQSVSDRLQSTAFTNSFQVSSEDSPTLLRRPFWDCYPDEDDPPTTEEHQGTLAPPQGCLWEESFNQSFHSDRFDFLCSKDSVRCGSWVRQVSPSQELEQTPSTLSKLMATDNTPVYNYLKVARPLLPHLIDVECKPHTSFFQDHDNRICLTSAARNLINGPSQQAILRPTQVCIYNGVTFSGEEQRIHADLEAVAEPLFFHGASVRVLSGCWLLYREPKFQGSCLVLEEGDTVLTHADGLDSPENGPTAITIGSIRRVVMDDSLPEIELKTQVGHSGTPQHLYAEASSLDKHGDLLLSCLTVKSGCWLAYDDSAFNGSYTILEVGRPPMAGCGSSLVAHVRSLRPLRMGGLKVWVPMDPKMVVYEQPHFQGQSRELLSNTPSLGTHPGLWGVASLRVISGIWVGYSMLGYKGRQYLLEEGEYQDCQDLCGSEPALLSFRFLVGDFVDPSLTLQERSDLPEPTESELVDIDVPDLSQIRPDRGTVTLSVRSGVWVAYSDRFFCGQQYILEKGSYLGELDWGDSCGAVMSLRPIRLVSSTFLSGLLVFLQLRAYSQPHYSGDSEEYSSEVITLASWAPESFRVIRGSWLLFDDESCGGNQFILREGHYPDLASCDCMAVSIKSLKPIPFSFSDPSISLFSLDSFEGLETVIVTATERLDNFFTQSLRVNSSLWVAYEYANFRGRQMLLGPSHVSVWARHSGWESVGSLYPFRQPKVHVRVWSRCLGCVLTADSRQGCLCPAKVFLSPPGNLDTQLWVFTGSLLKCKATRTCLSVIGGKVSPGAYVALWPQHGQTHQKWSLNDNGTISSHLNNNLVLDLKGGGGLDKDHLVTNDFTGDRMTQYWDIEVV
ncbi:very large A-kinase anchor protein isoform X1 [Arapaima gigas]